VSGETRWRVVEGLIAALAAVGADEGWAMQTPLAWTELNNVWWVRSGSTNVDAADVEMAVQRDVELELWVNSSQRADSSMLRAGARVSAAISTIAKYAKKEQWQDAKPAEIIVCGGVWSRRRQFEAEIVADDLCPRCKTQPETMQRILRTRA
jgi:hypothetical protein